MRQSDNYSAAMAIAQISGAMECFPFLDLPPEIRNQIYGLLLLTRTPPWQIASKPKPEVDAAILRVCRKLHAECKDLLYASNVFHAHPARLTSMPFLQHISRPVLSPNYCRLIRRFYIEVRLDVDNPWNGDDCAKAFNDVEELQIVAWQASYGTCGVQNLIPFTSVRRVGRATLEGTSVEPGLASWFQELMQSNNGPNEVPPMPEDVSLEAWDIWEKCNR